MYSLYLGLFCLKASRIHRLGRFHITFSEKRPESLGFFKGRIKREVLATKPIAMTYEITEYRRSALEMLEMLKNRSEAQGL